MDPKTLRHLSLFRVANAQIQRAQTIMCLEHVVSIQLHLRRTKTKIALVKVWQCRRNFGSRDKYLCQASLIFQLPPLVPCKCIAIDCKIQIVAVASRVAGAQVPESKLKTRLQT
jgi:hypothetical protein